MTFTWLKFEWDLTKVPTSTDSLPTHYLLRAAEKDEEDIVQKVIANAFSMDAGWGNDQGPHFERMHKSVSQAFEKEGGTNRCLVLLHGSRIIGTSTICTEAGIDNNLATGPCILHEYRSRGLGSILLKASLQALREAGLSQATGVTRDKTTVARFIYPKFGGLSAPYKPDFEPSPKLAA